MKQYITHNTIFIGDGYIQGNQIDVIPDQVIDPNSIAPGILNLRADLFFDLNLIIQNIQMRQYALHLDRPIELDIIKQLKPNIPVLLYEVQDDTDIKYLKSLLNTGVNLQLWTKLSESDHKAIKLDYLNLPLISRRDNVKVESVQESIKRYSNTKEELDLTQEFLYFSKKHYLSSGKIYPSLFAWKNQSPVGNIEEFSRADFSNQDFLNEIGHFLIWQSI